MKRSILKTAIILIISLSFGNSAAQPNDVAKKNQETYQLLNLFGDVFEQVRTGYVKETADKSLIESAINGMLNSLDPHSSYLNSDHYKKMQIQTRGKFGGLGIEVTMEKGYVRVVSPIDDTPAFNSGVKAGDLITHLDDKPIQGVLLSDAVKLMQGRTHSFIIVQVIFRSTIETV